MSRSKLKNRRGSAWAGLAILAAGSVFQIPSCEGILTTFNPGGTVFASFQDYELDALFGSIPDYSLDPSCVIPFYGINTGDTANGCSGQLIYPTTPGPRPQGQ